MKTKKLNKKLRIKKETITNLSNDVMTAIKVGNVGTSDVDPTACGGSEQFCTDVACYSWVLTCIIEETKVNC